MVLNPAAAGRVRVKHLRWKRTVTVKEKERWAYKSLEGFIFHVDNKSRWCSFAKTGLECKWAELMLRRRQTL